MDARWFLIALGASACRGPARPEPSRSTFADDVALLRRDGPIHVLEAPDGARVAVSPKYQGRVMTSSTGPLEQGFGWIHRTALLAGRIPSDDTIGGEERFWLGPEGGQFGFFFTPHRPFEDASWHVPAPLRDAAWETIEATATRAVFRTVATVTNWSGTTFTIGIERTVSILTPPATEGVRGVGFATTNTITNRDAVPWTRSTGLPAIWILAAYPASADTRAIVPFETSSNAPLVNDAYFGLKVKPERLRVDASGLITLTCDGLDRGKIGLLPERSKGVLGSYGAKTLTVIEYDRVPAGAPYVNAMWEQQKAPYAGDAINVYNDGAGPKSDPRDRFYELETSSPGAELAPGQSLVHAQRTFHFRGEPAALARLGKKLLGAF